MASVKKHIYHYAPKYINESEKFNHTFQRLNANAKKWKGAGLDSSVSLIREELVQSPLPSAAQVGSGLCSPH